jgi:uncharacterized Zn finger protein (UPF0148 family)
MKYVYVCPKCKTVYAKDGDLPDETQVCPDCNDQLIYLKTTKEEWDQKSSFEKLETKEKVIEERIHNAADPNLFMLEKLGKIEQHLSVIRGIMVFFTVISVLGAIMIFLGLL